MMLLGMKTSPFCPQQAPSVEPRLTFTRLGQFLPEIFGTLLSSRNTPPHSKKIRQKGLYFAEGGCLLLPDPAQ